MKKKEMEFDSIERNKPMEKVTKELFNIYDTIVFEDEHGISQDCVSKIELRVGGEDKLTAYRVECPLHSISVYGDGAYDVWQRDDVDRLWYVTKKKIAGVYSLRPDDVAEELRRYRILEDELGMSALTYHRVMKSMYCGADYGAGPGKAFYRKGGEIVSAWIIQVDYCKKKVLLGDPNVDGDEAVFLFSSYGDSWSLRKEDLE